MNGDNMMIGFLFLFLTILISRILNERATKKLTQEKKAELIDLFSQNRIYGLIIIISILALYFLVIKMNFFEVHLAFGIYTGLIVLFLIVTTFLAFRKLRSNGFPIDYINSFLITTAIKFIGIVVFLLLL